jgi:hypothetical protein
MPASSLNHIEHSVFLKRAHFLLDLLDMSPYKDRFVSQLSGGQKRRGRTSKLTPPVHHMLNGCCEGSIFCYSPTTRAGAAYFGMLPCADSQGMC